VGSKAEAEGPFHVTVTDPVRQGEGMHAFIVYGVSTRTALPQYSNAEFHVHRRFRDFEWLFSQLMEKWPGLIIPPLPEKAIAGKVSGADFTPEFIEARRRHLDMFLRRVTGHAELHHAEALQVFLEATDEAFEAAKLASRTANGQPGRLGQLLTDGWHGLRSWSGKSLGGIGASVGIGHGSGLPDGGGGDRQCEELRGYVTRLEAQLGALHRAAERLTKRHRVESSGMTEVGAAFAQLGANGDEDWPRPLASNLSHLGVTSDLAARSLGEQADAEAEHLDEPLRDVLRRLQQCKHALHSREYAFEHWQAAIATLDSRRSKAAKAIGAEATDGKAQQMELEIGEGEAAVRQAQAEYEQIKERTNREVARFQEVRVASARARETGREGGGERLQLPPLWPGTRAAPGARLLRPRSEPTPTTLPSARPQEVMHDVRGLLATFVRLQAESCKKVPPHAARAWLSVSRAHGVTWAAPPARLPALGPRPTHSLPPALRCRSPCARRRVVLCPVRRLAVCVQEHSVWASLQGRFDTSAAKSR
jgi:sorting nexin-1/2